MRQYRFIGKCDKYGGPYKIPYGAIITLLIWGKRRHVLVEYQGEKIRTMGTLLRKVKK